MIRALGWNRPSDLILAIVTIGFDPADAAPEAAPAPPLVSWWDELVTGEITAAK
jgi:hypothetical protein